MLVYLKSIPTGQDSYFIGTEVDSYISEIEQLLDEKRDVDYHQSALIGTSKCCRSNIFALFSKRLAGLNCDF